MVVGDFLEISCWHDTLNRFHQMKAILVIVFLFFSTHTLAIDKLVLFVNNHIIGSFVYSEKKIPIGWLKNILIFK